jgi:hypothetical protein
MLSEQIGDFVTLLLGVSLIHCLGVPETRSIISISGSDIQLPVPGMGCGMALSRARNLFEMRG